MKIIKNDILEAVFQIDENYAVVSGDERIYQLLVDNTLYSFNKMIHPDDLKGEQFGNCCILEYDVDENNEVHFVKLINPAKDV